MTASVALLQAGENMVAGGLEGGDDEGCAVLCQFRQEKAMFEKMLHLGSEVETHVGKGVVEGTGYFAGVAGAVEEVGVAKGDVAGAVVNLLGDVCEHGLDGDDEKAAVVYGYDRAVAAGVQTAAGGLGVAGRVGDRFFDMLAIAGCTSICCSSGPRDVMGVAVQGGQWVSNRYRQCVPAQMG